MFNQEYGVEIVLIPAVNYSNIWKPIHLVG